MKLNVNFIFHANLNAFDILLHLIRNQKHEIFILVKTTCYETTIDSFA